uniref:Cordon-bleu WH2 repeat protein-like 1a n=1 Tax=Astyanax mexicanus TaxID=7994 RepID=W5KBX7_ASTMX
MEQEELTERELTLTVQLPKGQEGAVVVHGSKPVMDLLVALCAQYHLNPSDHIIELISTNQNQIKFKPSSLIGSLEAERVILKPKGGDDSHRRGSNIPVPTVRLMINYRKSHKAVVRVNPRVPLAEILPAVCEKCEFDLDTTVLLRDSQAEDPLDLTKTLNDYGIRDLYAKDMKVVSNAPRDPSTPTHNGCEEEKLVMIEKRQHEKENKGFLSLFRRSKKTAEEGGSNPSSAPTSPAWKKQHVVSMSCLKASSPTPMPTADMPKKRRAPQPPSMMGSQSFPCGLNSSQSITLPADAAGGNQGVLTRVSSTESSLKRTKRRAPPPPCTSPSIPDSCDSDKERSNVGAYHDLTSLEEAPEEEDVQSHLCDSYSNQSSDFTGSLPTQSPSLMTEILSEFMDLTKAEKQDDLLISSTATYLPPAEDSSLSSPASDLDSSSIAPPGCQLWRNCSQREGLTTFTVVPRRRQTSPKHYEVLITLEASQANERMEIPECITKDDETLEWKNTEMENLVSKELNENETNTQEKGNSEDLEGSDAQLGILESIIKEFDKVNLDTDVEKHLTEETEDPILVDEEEKDWVEKYKERRRKFQGNDKKPVNLDKWMKDFEEKLGYTVEDEPKEVDNGFSPPPPPACSVYWEQDMSQRGIEDGTEGFKADREVEDKDSSLDEDEPYHEPMAYKVLDPYQDLNHFSNLHSSKASLNFGAPEVPLSLESPDHVQSSYKIDSSNTLQPNPVLSTVDCPHNHQNHSTADPPSPAPVSLFALAVARRAQTLQKWGVSSQASCSQTQLTGGLFPQRSSHCVPPAQAVRGQVFVSPLTYIAENGVRG